MSVTRYGCRLPANRSPCVEVPPSPPDATGAPESQATTELPGRRIAGDVHRDPEPSAPPVAPRRSARCPVPALRPRRGDVPDGLGGVLHPGRRAVGRPGGAGPDLRRGRRVPGGVPDGTAPRPPLGRRGGGREGGRGG